jgi:hypothetical protein
MRPPGKANGPLTVGPLATVTARSSDALSVARHRDLHPQQRISRQADRLMPMAVWYRQPKGSFYCTLTEGRWAS